MVGYFNDNAWSNAYVTTDMLSSLEGYADAAKAAFGIEIAAIKPTAKQFNIFNGFNYAGSLWVKFNTNQSTRIVGLKWLSVFK